MNFNLFVNLVDDWRVSRDGLRILDGTTGGGTDDNVRGWTVDVRGGWRSRMDWEWLTSRRNDTRVDGRMNVTGCLQGLFER